METEFEQIIGGIRRRYDLFELTGIRRRGDKGWGLCPLPMHTHHRNTPSFSIFTSDGVQRFKCHGHCGAFGDVIDFIGYREIAGYDWQDKAQRLEAAARLDSGAFSMSPPPRPRAAPLLAEWMWEKFLPPTPAVVDYLLKRGVLREQIERYKLGSASRIDGMDVSKTHKDNLVSIPVFHHGRLMAIKIRNTHPKARARYFSVEGSQKALWNHDAVFLTDEAVLVMKGEFAGIVASRHFLACAPTSGEWGHVDNIIKPLVAARKIIVGDNDEAGRRAAQQRAAILGGIARFPALEFKDWDEWYLARPDEAIAVTQQWIEEV